MSAILRLLGAVLGMVGAASLRRIAGGLGLVLVGGLALGCALGFGAVAIYQALLARFAPWEAACLIAGALAGLGAAVCWAGSLRLRRHPSFRELRVALPSLEPLAGLFGGKRSATPTPLQMVAVAALVGFALGRRR
jgi:hypothetical protein